MASTISGYIGKLKIGSDGTAYSLGSTAYGVCSTAENEPAKTVEMTGFTLIPGATIFVKFTNTNSAASPTLNVNNKGAKALVKYGTEVLNWHAGAVLCLTYDGTYWVGSSITLKDLGLTNAMHFIGKANAAITDGGTENPTITGYDFTNNKQAGDIVIGKEDGREYVWTAAGTWELLGQDASTTVDSGAPATNTWISRVQQNSDRTISVTTGTLDTSGAWSGNAATATKWKDAQKVYVTLGTDSTTTTIQGGSSSAQTIGVNGILKIANGGTNNSSFTANTFVYYDSTNTKLASYTTTKGGTKKLWYLNSGVPTDSTASEGGARNPVYLSSGSITAGNITFDTLNANRLMWTTATDQPYAGYHYANSTKIAINSTSEPTTNLFVNGTSRFAIGDNDNTANKRFIIGSSGKRYLSFGGAGIQAYGSDDTAGSFYLQYNGGTVQIGQSSSVTADTTIYGNFLPGNSNTYALGDNTHRWSQLYTYETAINTIMSADTSRAINIIAVTNTSNEYISTIGFHNTGDTNGAIYLLPYYKGLGSDTTYGGKHGLYIGTSVFKWENKHILRYSAAATSGNVIIADGITGDVKTSAYSLGATINSGTANRIAYYSGANAVSSGTITTNGSYLGNVSNLSVNTAHQTTYNLQVNGTSYFNHSNSSDAHPVISGTRDNLHLSIGRTGVQAYNNNTASTLALNYYGGSVNIGSADTATATRDFYGQFDLKSANGFTYSGIGVGSDNAARPVWFSYNGVVGRPVYDNDFKYNPAENSLHIVHASGKGSEFKVSYGDTVDMVMGIGSGDVNHGLYDNKASKWMIVADASGNVVVNGRANSAVYGVCTTAAGTAAKAVTVTPNFILENGAIAYVKFNNTNTAATPTLNISSTGAKSIYDQHGVQITASYGHYLQANKVYEFIYDATLGGYIIINNPKALELYERRTLTTNLNKAAGYGGIGAMFHLVATSSTTDGKSSFDANVLQMNWDNNGGYDSQLAISTSYTPTRMQFRSGVSSGGAWQEVAHAAANTQIGSGSQPVYVTSTGVITAITGALDNNINGSAAGGIPQNTTTISSWRKILLTGGDSYAAWNTAVSDRTAIAYQSVNVSVQPSTNTLKASNLAADQTIKVGTLTLGGSADPQTKTLSSSSTLYLNTTANSSVILGVNSTNKVRLDTNGYFRPESDGGSQLGTSDVRWAKLYVGTAASYGSGTQPIYWNNGVPKATDYALNATINSGTANQVAYYSGANAISSKAPAWEAWTAGTTAGPKANIQIGNATYTSAAIPSASATASGIVTTGNQTFKGIKTFYNEGTTTDNIPTGIAFSNKDTTTGQSYSSCFIYGYQDHGATSYGLNLVIKPGGNLFIGGGESAAQLYDAIGKNSTTEHAYITADNNLYLEANVNTTANRKGIIINTAGNVYPIAAEAANNDAQNLGATDARWQNIYASRSINVERAGEATIILNNTTTNHKIEVISGASGNAGLFDMTKSFYFVNTDQTNGDTTVQSYTNRSIYFKQNGTTKAEIKTTGLDVGLTSDTAERDIVLKSDLGTISLFQHGSGDTYKTHGIWATSTSSGASAVGLYWTQDNTLLRSSTTITPVTKREADLGSFDYSWGKGYIGRLYITSEGSRYKYISFSQANSPNSTAGIIQYDSGNVTNISSGIFTFIEYSPQTTATTASTGYYESYSLPTVASGLTGNVGYNILTTKNKVTIAQGGTNATTQAGAFTNIVAPGGAMTGPLSWTNSTALPAATSTEFFLTIDAFADGGKTKYITKANAIKSLVGSSAIGSSTKPVYWTGSAFSAIGYTIETSVPSGAVFTDTKVTQSSTTTTNWRKVLLSYQDGSSGAAVSSNTNITYASAALEYQPSTGTLKATKFQGPLDGNATTATTLQTSRTIQTNLGSTTAASFNGSANITPGVTGTLPIANGGTGATTGNGAAANLGVRNAIQYSSSSGSAMFYVQTNFAITSSANAMISFEISVSYSHSSVDSCMITGSAYWNKTTFTNTNYYDPLGAVTSIDIMNVDGMVYLGIKPKSTYQYYRIGVFTTHNHTQKAVSASTTAPTASVTVSVSRKYQTASMIDAGTFRGAVTAAASPAVGTKYMRSIYAGTSDMVSGTTNLETGVIYLYYV